MGWSCRDDAAKVENLWVAKCVAETGSSNTYKVGKEYYFFDTSRKEHDDGAITGSVMKMVTKDGAPVTEYPKGDGFFARKVGSYKISGDGDYVRGPAFLKELAAKAKTMTSSECYALAYMRKGA